MSILNSNNFLYKTVDGVKQFFSPLVNASTVVLKNGSRLEKDGKVYADQAVNAEMLGGKEPKYYIQPRNLLDNSDFEVAQAGYNGLHGNELYHADRWFGNGLGTLAVSGGVKTFTSTSGFAFMRQILWNDGRDHGKTYTLVITLPDGTRLAGSGKSPSAPSTSEQVFIDITAPDSRCWFMLMKMPDDVMCVRVDASQTGASVSFLHMDLFEGVYTAESAPPHLPKGYDAEMMTCRKFYRIINNECLIPYHKSTATRYYRRTLDTPMRANANPSVMIVEAVERDAVTWADITSTVTALVNEESGVTLCAEGDSGAGNFFMNFTAHLSADL